MIEWKDIKDYEGLYRVSNTGKVKSLERVVCNGKTGSKRTVRERVLSTSLRTGYNAVNLSRSNQKNVHKVSRLVARAFLSNWESKPYVDHINGDRTDDRVTNLRMVTNQENCLAFKTKAKNTSSQYRGVTWDKQTHKWRASIMFNSKYLCLGRFYNEADAAQAYEDKRLTIIGAHKFLK